MRTCLVGWAAAARSKTSIALANGGWHLYFLSKSQNADSQTFETTFAAPWNSLRCICAFFQKATIAGTKNASGEKAQRTTATRKCMSFFNVRRHRKEATNLYTTFMGFWAKILCDVM